MGANETDRQEPGKSLGDGLGALDWWNNHVGRGRRFYEAACRAHGGNESAAGGLDWRSTNSFCDFPRNFQIDVHHRRRAGSRLVASGRPGVFVLSVDADDGGSHCV